MNNPIDMEGRPADNKTIMRLYSAFAASLLLLLVPHMAFCVIALLLFTGTLIAAYGVRGKEEDKESLTANHATFLIRTIWIGSVMALLTTMAGSAYLLAYADDGPLTMCANNAAQAIVNSGMQPDYGQLNMMMQPCIDEYIHGNMNEIVTALLIAGGLPLLYFVFRLAKGLSRARKGHRIGDVKSYL